MDFQQLLGNAGAFLPLILMLVLFYFILIRPQRKKEKELRNMIAALKVGDEVATVGGIHGKIARIKDDSFVIESGVGTMKSFIMIDRSAVSRVTKSVSKEDEVAPAPELDADSKAPDETI